MKRPRSLGLFREAGGKAAPAAEPVGTPSAGDLPPVAPTGAEVAPDAVAAPQPTKPPRRGLFGRRKAAADAAEAADAPETVDTTDDAPPSGAETVAPEPVVGRRGLRDLFSRRAKGAVEGGAGDAPSGGGRKGFRMFGRRKAAAADATADDPFGAVASAGVFDPMDVAAGLATLAADTVPAEFEIDEQGRLIENGKKPYAVGLLWLPYDLDRKVSEQAADAGFGDDAPDLYVVVGDREQIGFGYKYNGLKIGMPAAATLFSSDVLPGNWLAAFELPGDMGQSWWLVAWRDGQVYEDRVITDPNDAQSAFAALQEAPNWSAAICPVAWDIDGTIDYSLGAVLGKRARPAKLKSTSQIRALLPIAIPVALLAVAAVAGFIVWQNIQEQRRLDELERLRQERLRQQQQAEPVEVVPPWEGMPLPARFVDVCTREFEELLIVPAGWRIEPQTCTIDGDSIVVQTSWRRESGGRLAWFLATLRDAGYENFAVSEDLQRVTIFAREPITEPGPDRSIRALSATEVQERLMLRFDTLDLPLNMRLVAPRAAPARQDGQPVWTHHEITFQESTSLEEYLKLISDIPARVPDELTYDVYSQQWRIVLRLYHEARGDE